MKKHSDIRVATASFPMEAIAVGALFLILALMTLPAQAATRTTGLYTETVGYGRSFEVNGTATGIGEESRAALARQQVDRSYLLGGTYIHPTVFGSRERPMNLYMSAGAGVAVSERSYEAASRDTTTVAPSFRVGMGLKYTF